MPATDGASRRSSRRPLAELLLPTASDHGLLAFTTAVLALPVSVAVASLRYSTDDYYMFSSVTFSTQDIGYNFAGNGRPGQALLADLLHGLGVTPPSGPLFTALQLAALVYVGWLLGGLWRIEDRAGRALVAILYGSHPFFAELYSYSIIVFFVAAALPFAVAGIVVCPVRLARDDLPRFGLATVLLAASLSIYQLFFAHAAVAVLVLGAVAVIGAAQGEAGGGPWQRFLRSGVLTRVLAMTLALAVYWLVNAAYLRWSGFGMVEQGRLLPLDAVPDRLHFVLVALNVYLFRENALFTGPLTFVVLGLLAAVAGLAALARLWRDEVPRAALAGSLLLLGLFATALGLVPGLSMMSVLYDPSPRILSAAAVLVAGVFAIGAVAVRSTRTRRALIVLGAVAAFSFLGIQNRALIDQQRLNNQDQLMASRILVRLSEFERFRPNTPVALVGGRWDFRGLGVETAIGNQNISAFAYDWSKLYILREVSGYPLQVPTPEQQERALVLARKMPVWPRPGSVRYDGELAVVRLP